MNFFEKIFGNRDQIIKNLGYPSRNSARAILMHLFNQSALFNRVDINAEIITKERLTAYLILWYEKKLKYTFVTFAFTNALVDFQEGMHVKSENYIDNLVLTNADIQIGEIDSYFKKMLGQSVEDTLYGYAQGVVLNEIKFNDGNKAGMDYSWFNSSDKFIGPLLGSYQSFKKERGMLFQKDDIKQIPIDYSIVCISNHFKQMGFVSEKISAEIIQLMVTATNNCLNHSYVDMDNIKEIVMSDMKNSNNVDAAYKFIIQL